MTNPLDTIKKLKGKSLEEIRTRGGQVVSAYSEQIGISGKVPTDRELYQLIDTSTFEDKNLTPQIIFDKFFENSKTSFFPSFFAKDKTIESFSENFDDETVKYFIEKANKIIDGRFDLLGFKNLNFGETVDWHYEPIADKHSPLKHWKQFDELGTKETGDKKIIWELNRHQYFFTLGVAYWLTGDERYAATFVRHIDSWMEQNAPGMGVNWFSSLEVAFRAMSWLWAFHLFEGSNSLTPSIFQKALKFLFIHGRHLEKYLSTYYSPNTHLTGEALGLYYLGTQLPFFKRAKHWRDSGSEILFAELDNQIYDDGVYFEQTTWYQRYTADFYLHFIILKKLNADFSDSDSEEKLSEKTQKLLDFLMFVTRPDGTTPLIGDDDGGRCLPLTSSRPDDFRGTLNVGSLVFNRGDYKFVSGEVSQELLWLLGSEGVRAFESIHPDKPEIDSRDFKDGGYFVMRDGWSQSDNYLLVDVGEVGAMTGGHGHADALSFELAVGGRTLLVDSGTYTYHKSKELRDFYRSSPAHNVLTIDEKSSSEPGEKFAWETKAETRVENRISEDRFDFLEATHNGYRYLENSPAELTRSILFIKNDYWIMRDFVKTVGEHSYQQNFHFNAKTNPHIENLDNGRSCVGESPENETGLQLFTFGDKGAWQRKESWISKCYGERLNAPFLRYVSKGIGPQEFLTFMIPAEKGFYKPEVVETEVVGGRAFVINYREYQDVFIFGDTERVIRTELFNTDFRFLWARLSEGEKMPEEFVMIGGKKFSLGGREIINYPNKLEFAVARRLGNRLNVRTSESVFSVSIPQSNSKTFILKNTPEL